MVKKTRKQKERAAKRREYLTRLVEIPVKEEISKKEFSGEAKVHLEQRSEREKVKVGSPIEFVTIDFKKALILSGLFIAVLVVLAILEAKYGFLGPLASGLMERLVH